jgi:hypothetical protein
LLDWIGVLEEYSAADRSLAYTVMAFSSH